MAENEKKVKAPAKSKKNTAENAGTEAKPAVKAKTVTGEAKPRAKAAKTKEIAEPIANAANSGPQAVPSKAKPAAETPKAAVKETTSLPTHQQIAQLAHRFWKERGGHHGSHEQDWLRAERELRGKAS